MILDKLTYEVAFEELNNISAQLEAEEVDIDQITTMVKRAKELMDFCQSKLRKIESELDGTKPEN